MPTSRHAPESSSRRDWLKTSLTSLAVIGTAGRQSLGAADERDTAAPRIRHSLVHWCYRPHWPDLDEMCRVAVRLGCESIELIDPAHWPKLKEHGLTCAIAGSHGFRTGFVNRDDWARCRSILFERFEQCRQFGVSRVITFTGMSPGLPVEQAVENCVEGLKSVVGEAEKQGITLCLEMLNTRDDSHPMKGHPGYLGDHCDLCIEMIKRVGSPNLKLLFDIYHVQIMDGDVIRRLQTHREFIGHIHTAGNPGRGELDDRQEIHYPAVMRALVETGYDGFVGHEFIPTGDPRVGLEQAIERCSV